MSQKSNPMSKKSREQAAETAPWWLRRGVRETIESIAIAFMLAFLFRTFEAEAFVIPTGSMAPTLQGMHKDVQCPKCGFWYQAGASNESEEDTSGPRPRKKSPDDIDKLQVVVCVCPMCRFELPVDPKVQKTYNGDRILVTKFSYEFSEPERWDVFVFRFPGDAKTNYIKRLVGLPGEELLIRHGDIYTRKLDANGNGEGEYEISRKPPYKVRAMLQLVHDTDYDPAELYRRGWPLRWRAWPPEADTSVKGWSAEIEDAEGKVVRQNFSTTGMDDEDAWIRYQHTPPWAADWNQLRQSPAGETPPDFTTPHPQLITDFYAYDACQMRGERNGAPAESPGRAAKMGLHWVGDLAVEADVRVDSAQGELLFDLVKAGEHYTCRIDVATGAATLSLDGAPAARTELRGPGNYNVMFANVDHQLLLWIDGTLAEFDKPTTYAPTGPARPFSTSDDAGDLAPAGVGSRGASVAVDRLKVHRDIYYIADTISFNDPITDYDESLPPFRNASSPAGLTPTSLRRFLSNPEEWDVFLDRRESKFILEADQFLALGDNSPQSKDSRLWTERDGLPPYYVPRRLLIGKALFIYWPHSWNRIPGTGIPFPYFPNFEKMGFVR